MKISAAVFCLYAAAALVCRAAGISVTASHRAKFNLSGAVLGVYDAGTRLIVKNIAAGDYKLYVRSLFTGELRVFNFTVHSGDADVQAGAFNVVFSNDHNRDESALGVALFDALGNKRARRILGLSGGGEVIYGPLGPPSGKGGAGNCIIVEVPGAVFEVNLDGGGKQKYRPGLVARYDNLKAGRHKVYIRRCSDSRLFMFKVCFQKGKSQTVRIRPDFSPGADSSLERPGGPNRRESVLRVLLDRQVLERSTGAARTLSEPSTVVLDMREQVKKGTVAR